MAIATLALLIVNDATLPTLDARGLPAASLKAEVPKRMPDEPLESEQPEMVIRATAGETAVTVLLQSVTLLPEKVTADATLAGVIVPRLASEKVTS